MHPIQTKINQSIWLTQTKTKIDQYMPFRTFICMFSTVCDTIPCKSNLYITATQGNMAFMSSCALYTG